LDTKIPDLFKGTTLLLFTKAKLGKQTEPHLNQTCFIGYENMSTLVFTPHKYDQRQSISYS